MRRIFLAALALALAATSGYAAVSDSITLTTVTTASGNCLPQNNQRQSLAFDATGATANIGYCEGNNCTAAIGTVGTTTLNYGTRDYWPAGSAPINAFCFISSSGSQPLTIREGTGR